MAPENPDDFKTENENSVFKERSFQTYAQAEERYFLSMHRLLSVGGWNALTGRLPGFYKLYNQQGEVKVGNAEEGDFIVVSNFTNQQVGDSYYHIEKKIAKLHEQNKSIALITRPVELNRKGPAVSFTTTGTNTITIVLQLNDKKVSMAVFEKDQANNIPADESFYEKVLHKLQEVFNADDDSHWAKLVKGILN